MCRGRLKLKILNEWTLSLDTVVLPRIREAKSKSCHGVVEDDGGWWWKVKVVDSGQRTMTLLLEAIYFLR